MRRARLGRDYRTCLEKRAPRALQTDPEAAKKRALIGAAVERARAKRAAARSR